MMSGIASGSWSLVNFILLQVIGPRSNLMNNQQWEAIFWIIALLPAVGIAVWLVLSRNQRRTCCEVEAYESRFGAKACPTWELPVRARDTGVMSGPIGEG